MTVLDTIAEKLHFKTPATKEESNKGPVLDNSKITVIFVLGGPGAGMGLQLNQPQVCS